MNSLIAPVFTLDDTGRIATPVKGVGLFHDRIYFCSSDITIMKVAEVIQNIKEEIARKVAKDVWTGGDVNSFMKEVRAFTTDYLQIYALEAEIEAEDNPLLVLSDNLDALELEKSYTFREKRNYFLSLFENENIKYSFLTEDCGGFGNCPVSDQKKTKMRMIEDIARGERVKAAMKKYSYYAIVQADGDNMGKILKGMRPIQEEGTVCSIAEQVRMFSNGVVS